MWLEAVIGVLARQRHQLTIARGLGENRRRRDRRHQRVALDDGTRGVADERHMVAIDPDFVGHDQQFFNRPPHRQQTGIENVHAVDFVDTRGRDGKGQGFGLDAHGQALALLGAELF